jgi:hypothetical protein
LIDLVFNDSTKADLIAAGISTAAQTEALWLELDIGDISGLPDLSCREDVMRSVLAGPANEDVSEDFELLWHTHRQALARIKEAAQSGEPVRVWWSDAPHEVCGLYFAATLLADSCSQVTSVKLPPYFEEGNSVTFYDSLSSVPPELLHRILPLEQETSFTLRHTAAWRWRTLTDENAPLRAMVNGRLISVPADFYDHILRRCLPDGEFIVARAIGKTMGETQLGVRDWWFAQRIRAMTENGELEIVASDQNFYHTKVRKSAPCQ